MYGWLFRHLPGPLWARILLIVVLVAALVDLWHFLATPIHGSIDETSVYTDQERVLALSEIGRLRVADPAIDLAAASALIDPVALPTFFEEYRNSRPRADEFVISRAELLAEFAVLDWLLEAVDSGDESAIQDAAELLDSFSDVLFSGTNTAGEKASAVPADDSAAPEPDVEAAITEQDRSDVFIPEARPTEPTAEETSEFDSAPGSSVSTAPTPDESDAAPDDADSAPDDADGVETGRIPRPDLP